MYIYIYTSLWGPEPRGEGRLCRWFNGDYRSRKKCLSCDPHGGSPLHAAAGRRFRAADRDGEETAWCCWHWDDWCRLVMREQLLRRHGGHERKWLMGSGLTPAVLQPSLLPPDKLSDSSVCTRSWMYSCVMLLFNSGAFFFTLKSSIRNLFCFSTFKGIVSVCLLDEAAVPRKITASVVFPQKNVWNQQMFTVKWEPRRCCSDYDSYLSGGTLKQDIGDCFLLLLWKIEGPIVSVWR